MKSAGPPDVAEHDRQMEIRRIGRQLRLLREKSGRSLSQLAEAAGLSERAVRELEAGRTNPSLTTVVGIVDALGVSLDEVVAAARSDPAASHTPAAAILQGDVDLSAQLPRPRMQARLVRLGSLEIGRDAPSAAVFAHVLAGAVHVNIDGEDATLRPGDSLHAQAGVPRTWRASAEGGQVLMVETTTAAGAGEA